eukprot:2469230-Pleurochrysis_carterae.AAC.1
MQDCIAASSLACKIGSRHHDLHARLDYGVKSCMRGRITASCVAYEISSRRQVLCEDRISAKLFVCEVICDIDCAWEISADSAVLSNRAVATS